VKKYAENKEANSQVNKIKELVALGYSDEEIAKRFEIDGEENLAASGTIWSNSDIEKIRFSFNFSPKKRNLFADSHSCFFYCVLRGGNCWFIPGVCLQWRCRWILSDERVCLGLFVTLFGNIYILVLVTIIATGWRKK